jgi:sugar phosphate isomerase/epimerase
VPRVPDIAISTGAYVHLSLSTALVAISELAQAAEVTSYREHSLLELDNARAVAASGLPFSVHGPFFRVDLGSLDEARRRAAVELHRRHLKVAALLGATMYLVHPDRQRRPGPRRPEVVAALQRSLRELCDLQEQTGVPVVVENMPVPGLSHFVAPGDADLCGLGLGLDVGHAFASGTLDAWLADPRAPLRHVHLHDNHGRPGGDEHLPLGAGDVDVAAVMAVVRAAGLRPVLEHRTPLEVEASISYLYARGLLP